MKKLITTTAAAFAVATSAQAVIIADLADDYATAIAGTPSAGDTFGVGNWSFTSTAGGDTLEFFASGLGNNNVAGYADPNSAQFGSQLPAISDSDFFDGGTTPADRVQMHSGGGGQLVVTWTADQDYTDFVVNYAFTRAGDDGVLDTGTATLTIGGTAGATLAATANDAQAGFTSLATIASVSAGETVTFQIAGAGGGDSFGNFQIDATAVPEPSSTALLGIGGLALILRRRK